MKKQYIICLMAVVLFMLCMSSCKSLLVEKSDQISALSIGDRQCINGEAGKESNENQILETYKAFSDGDSSLPEPHDDAVSDDTADGAAADTEPPLTKNEEEIMEYMPIVVINTIDGNKVPTDKRAVDCDISLFCSQEKYYATNLAATIRVRGNGSLGVGKQTGKYPYRIDFAKEINPFGLGDGAEKKWCLLANASDHTMLRNYAAKRLGDMLSGISFSSNSMMVHVYLNSKYIGVYELTEQVEVSDVRVNVNDEIMEGEDNGFLLELDFYAKKGDADDVFFTVGENDYTVKSDINNADQLEYIVDYIKKVEAAIYSGDREEVERLVDIDSFVDMYLLQEFIKNTDAGYSSFFMCKDAGGKLFFTAPWDFDLSLGNDRRVDSGSYKYIYIGEGRDGFVQNHHWYIKLYSYDWFRQLVIKRWEEISPTLIVQLINEVEHMADIIESDMQKSNERWNFLGKRIQQEPSAVYKLATYKEQTDYLIKWMNDRKDWLDEHWKEQ